MSAMFTIFTYKYCRDLLLLELAEKIWQTFEVINSLSQKWRKQK